MRHSRDHFLIHRHLFLDGTLHSNQANPELVLQELADGAHATVSKMIDIIDLPDIFAELEQISDNGIEIGRLQDPFFQRRREIELDIEFQAPDPREVVLA